VQHSKLAPAWSRGVKLGPSAMTARGPLLPNKRTFARYRRMSQKCQNRPHAPQQTICADCIAYSITSSAAACNVSGTVRPSVFAVLRLMTRSNLVGCTTGKSPGLAPFSIRPA
jgi:hypothetical protein